MIYSITRRSSQLRNLKDHQPCSIHAASPDLPSPLYRVEPRSQYNPHNLGVDHLRHEDQSPTPRVPRFSAKLDISSLRNSQQRVPSAESPYTSILIGLCGYLFSRLTDSHCFFLIHPFPFARPSLFQLSTMSKPIVLQLGDDIRWNHELYDEFKSQFEIRRSYSMPRAEFIQALKTKAFGDFFAIYRPFWNTGGEMGNWDDELISLLPSSCKIYASAGAGFDWVDTARLAKQGMLCLKTSNNSYSYCLRRHILQRCCCLHRVSSRCSNLAHHLRLSTIELVQHRSPFRRQGSIYRRKPEPGPYLSKPQRFQPRHYWLRSHWPTHRREGLQGSRHEDPVQRRHSDA